MEKNQISTSDFQPTGQKSFSLEARLCVAFSLTLLAAGIFIASGLHSMIIPFWNLVSRHPLETTGLVIGASVAVFALYLYVTYTWALHILNHLMLFGGIGVGFYFLGIDLNYKGETVLNIWGLVLVEIALITLTCCVARHSYKSAKRLSVNFGLCQGVFLFVLFITWSASGFETTVSHFHEAQAQFGEKHKGKLTAPVEQFEYKGRTFKCYVAGSEPTCEFPY